MDSAARHRGRQPRAWSTTVTVDKKAVVGGAMGVDAIAKAPKTGYELLLGSIGPLTINPARTSDCPTTSCATSMPWY